MEEIWKDIEGYVGLYQVSNTGKVKSLSRYVNCLCEKKRKIQEKLLKLHRLNSGYLFVVLCNKQNMKQILVHRLVAKTFIENDKNYQEINHKDGNKENNTVSNLEWCSRSYNLKHCYRYLESGKIKKEKISKRFKGKKLNEEHRKKIGIANNGIKSVTSKPVKDILTGEVFGSIKELSRKKNKNFSYFQKGLSLKNIPYVFITREEYFERTKKMINILYIYIGFMICLLLTF